jgi:hypothetical protein
MPVTLVALPLAVTVGCSSAERGESDAAVDVPLAALTEALTLHASFDNGPNADFASGNPQLYTVPPGAERDEAQPGLGNPDVELLESQGRFGGALEFNERNRHAIFYHAEGNVAFTEEGWSGSVSFWLNLTPNEDLADSYCDPIQITDASYDDAAVWVDFTRDNPRQFRLGVFGDREAWNPEQLSSDDYPFFVERLVIVDDPPFQRGEWTHVVVTYHDLNSESGGGAQLYLNGRLQGETPQIGETFTWDLAGAEIRIGVNYIGLYDELALFSRALTPAEVSALHRLEGGVAELHR